MTGKDSGTKNFDRRKLGALVQRVSSLLSEYFPNSGLHRYPGRIMRLVYLVDWLYSRYSQDGNSFTRATWVNRGGEIGPYSEQVKEVMVLQRNEDGFLFLEGVEESDPFLLDDLVKKIAEYVVSSFGDYPSDELMELIYGTPPFRNSNPNEVIDL